MQRLRCYSSRVRKVAALLVGAVITLSGPVATAANVFRGGELFREHCQDCHGGDGSGVPGVPDLTRGSRLFRSDPELFAALNDGKGVMPGYAGILRTQDILDVIGYLRTLR